MGQDLPRVIGISGISGAGKSTLINQLSQMLKATTVHWDDYDPISKSPDDYVKWYKSGKNYDAWVFDDLANTLKQLKSGNIVICPATKQELLPTKYILFDAPLGYCHQGTGKQIDFLVCLDTPLDIALARRVLRECKEGRNPEQIVQDLENYLLHARPLFILSEEQRKCDLLLDGSLPINEQCQKILTAL